MPLTCALGRALTFGKSTESDYAKPNETRSQTAASPLHRKLHKSKFLYGRQPPTTGTQLTPAQVLDITHLLSQPLCTPLLATDIANLRAPLSRSHDSFPSDCLCDVHSWFDLRWIDWLTDVIGEEIGPRLDNLRNAPHQFRSLETEGVLETLDNHAHLFPVPDQDGSRTAKPYDCNRQSCAICKFTTCKACKLSILFQNTEAIKALSMCAKGRKKRSSPWPEMCAWLDPEPGCGWEMKWKEEGLPILTDRIIIRKWKKVGGQKRMAEALTSIRDSVRIDLLADHENTNEEAGTTTPEPYEETLCAESVYEDIVERRWTALGDAMKSNETVSLLRDLAMNDGNRDSQESSERADHWEKAYGNLFGSKPQIVAKNSSQSLHHYSGVTLLKDGGLETMSERKARARKASRSNSSVGRTSQSTQRSFSLDFADEKQRFNDKGAESHAGSYASLVGSVPQTQSNLSFQSTIEEDEIGLKRVDYWGANRSKMPATRSKLSLQSTVEEDEVRPRRANSQASSQSRVPQTQSKHSLPSTREEEERGLRRADSQVSSRTQSKHSHHSSKKADRPDRTSELTVRRVEESQASARSRTSRSQSKYPICSSERGDKRDRTSELTVREAKGDREKEQEDEWRSISLASVMRQFRKDNASESTLWSE